MSRLDEAGIAEMYNFVQEGHSGQVDLGGVKYIHHLRAVADRLRAFNDTSLIKCALGHDYIEDVPNGRARIVAGPVTNAEIATIEALSVPPKAKGVSHTDHYIHVYIPGLIAKGDLRALLIKISDNLHNSDPERSVGNSERDILRTYRYLNSLMMCLEASRSLLTNYPEWGEAFADLEREATDRAELLRIRCLNYRDYIENAGFSLR